MGSLEDVNEERLELLDELLGVGEEAIVNLGRPHGAIKYRELWSLRATLEEEEDFSDTLRMEDMMSPEEEEDAVSTEDAGKSQ